jgi:hypothetical protein
VATPAAGTTSAATVAAPVTTTVQPPTATATPTPLVASAAPVETPQTSTPAPATPQTSTPVQAAPQTSTPVPAAPQTYIPAYIPVPPVALSDTTEPAAPAAAENSGYGCNAALAYLRANAEPSYQLVCPGYAYGGQAVTCNHHAPQCADYNIIIINTPCPTAYKNEAANSWTLVRNDGVAMDPFGATC